MLSISTFHVPQCNSVTAYFLSHHTQELSQKGTQPNHETMGISQCH